MKYTNPQIESSYRQYNIGKTLYDLVLKLKPKTIVEFGTLNGYSAVAMGMALHELGEGHLISYDLWDGYKYRHGRKDKVQETIDGYGLSDFITLSNADFYHWEPTDFDLLHVDLSNDAEKIQKLAQKVKNSTGMVIFEGGSKERDEVQWMSRYNRPHIRSSGIRYEVIESRFPSVSRLLK